MFNQQALHSYLKRHPTHTPAPPKSHGVPVAPGCWSIPELAKSYGLPTGQFGTAEIWIGELGGAHYMSDTEAAFHAMGLPVPTVTVKSADGTEPQPDPGGADGEVGLDVQMAAAIYSLMTGKPAHIVLCYSSDIGVATQFAAANGAAVMSWSWGASESEWGSAALNQMEAIATSATGGGMTIFAASGDNDANDGGGAAAVDAPASCPHVVGCGGTHKTSETETVWNDTPGNPSGEGTGGGYSAHFAVQAWQVGIPTPPAGLGRLVPDIAADADPQTGIMIYLANEGGWLPIGGTSAVAPFFAGVAAACAIKLTGDLNPVIWSDAGKVCFNPDIPGENGVYTQPPVPGPCSGCGVPIGVKLAALLADQ